MKIGRLIKTGKLDILLGLYKRIKIDMINLQPGDIILYNTPKKFSIGVAIKFFMRRYAKKLKLVKKEVYNHSATVIDLYDTIYVGEAIGTGINIRPFELVYGSRLNRIKVLTPKKAYSKAEKNKISKVVVERVLIPTRYDFLNFWYQIRMIMKTTRTGKKEWVGPTGKKASKRLYCTEASATWANLVRPGTFDKPWTVNPLDIDINKYYKVKYNGLEK